MNDIRQPPELHAEAVRFASSSVGDLIHCHETVFYELCREHAASKKRSPKKRASPRGQEALMQELSVPTNRHFVHGEFHCGSVGEIGFKIAEVGKSDRLNCGHR